MWRAMLPLLLLSLLWAMGGASQAEWEQVEGRVFQTAMDTAQRFKASDILALMNPDGSFSDLEDRYGTVEDKSKALRKHGDRLGALLYHHHQDEHADYTDSITLSFQFLANDSLVNHDTNFWGHVMGVPLKLWRPLILAKHVISRELRDRILDKYWINTPAGPVWNLSDLTGAMSGGNLGSRAITTEVRAVLTDEPSRTDIHNSVKERLYKDLAEMRPFGDNGLRPDGCLHQHNIIGKGGIGHLDHILHMIYNGSYGREMLHTLAKVFSWFDGIATLNFEEETVEKLFWAFIECHQWLFRGKTFEPTTTGRFIERGDIITKWATKQGVDGVAETLLKIKLGNTIYKDILEDIRHRYASVTPDPEHALEGNKHFFSSDLTVHHRREYMASVRVLSLRTTRQETWSTLNYKGYFQGDGFLTVLVDSLEYGVEKAEVFLVYDWARVPGVTNLYTTNDEDLEYETNPNHSKYSYNNATFVGGVTDGLVGVTTMQYNRPSVTLKAHKSWFFFNDVILVIGSGITLPDEGQTGQTVTTTLAQVADAGSHAMEVDELNVAKWLHHRQVGYVFLNGDEQLKVETESRIHDSKTIDIFTAYLDHGHLPKDVTLTYAVLPAADVEKTRAFSEHPDVEVISSTNDLHAACHHPSKTFGAALVAPTEMAVSCGGSKPIVFSVNLPCLALITIEDAKVKVTLSDPTQLLKVVQVMVARGGQEKVKTIEFPAAPNQGSSVSTVFTL